MLTAPRLAPSAALSSALVLSLASGALAQTAPTFTNQTATRLVAAGPVGANDPTEKSYGIGDLDGDGLVDIVAGRRTRPAFPSSLGKAAAAPNTLFMNIGGVLTDKTAALAPDLLVSNATRDVLVHDLNGNGLLDVMIADGDSNVPQVLLNQGLDINGNWLGLADAPGAVPSSFLVDAWTLAAGDLKNDKDKFHDIFVGTRQGTDRLLVNLGLDAGGNWLGFADETFRLGANANTSASKSSAAIDINADGDVDIIRDVTNPTGQLQIVSNDGTGMFTAAVQVVASGSSYNFGLGHIDNDGIIDFFAVRNAVDQFRLNLGPGAGDLVNLGPTLFAPSSTNGFGARCVVGDLNGDGTDDFLVCDLDQEFPNDCSRRLNILLNPGTGTSLTDAYPTPVPWEPNGTSDVVLIDLDGDGDLDMLIGHCTGNSVYMHDGSPCYADCDGNVVLNIDDFLCFQLQFALQDPYADCDGNSLFNIDDFLCFQLAFALGC